MCQYEIDRDKQADTQAFFASMTDEQIANECPEGVTKVGRWHDVPNGCGVMIVETNDQNALTAWLMGWSGQCTFPVVTPVKAFVSMRAWSCAGPVGKTGRTHVCHVTNSFAQKAFVPRVESF